MLAYGLFLARLSAGAKDKITLNNAREHVPGSFRLIHELVEFLTELTKPEYQEVRWVVEEVLSLVNGLDLTAIQEDLSFRQRKAISRKVRAQDEEEHRLFERDPFIYFYEDYLKAYDKDMRKGRGVYYTPPPIVNFIVRAVDDILKGTFGIKDGLADHRRVTVLDFACGTGTFLLEAFQRIFENIGGADSGRADLIVREHILKNLYGFEYLIAPYTIAHLKLSQYLKDKGHPLQDMERLQVFLTNTLEPIEPQRNFYLPAITEEVKAAQEVKDKPVLVITGNPPYAAHSKNKGEWITEAIEAYKIVDGKPFGEKKHWLHDDYVKFIRFAQMKMDGGLFEYIDKSGNRQSTKVEGVEQGVVGVITNHSWLDNPTFRGMRQSLMNSFEQIYVIDLHGNTKKKETAADGSKDENVFDIEQGVSVALFVKRAGLERGVWRGDIWGSRLYKYETFAGQSLKDFDLVPLTVEAPHYLFKALSSGADAQAFNQFWKIQDIFVESSAGIITARDRFAIAFSDAELKHRVSQLLDEKNSDDSLRATLGLDDTRGWALTSAREALRKKPDWKNNIRPILQAPFDVRRVAYDIRLIDWGRWNFIAKLSDRKLALCLPRKIDIQKPWDHVFVTDEIFSHHAISMKEVNYAFPVAFDGRENLSEAFRTFLDQRFDHHYTAEEIMGYIYAVLHSPTYRSRYAEFLRIDFPRIPFPEDAADFEFLSKLGWALVEAHLLREMPVTKLAQYHGKGGHVVEAVRYAPAEQAVWINKTQCFRPVPEAAWNFHIGGYRVLEKYLKSRKGRTLSLDEINHFVSVAGSLAFTSAQMAKIDKAYGKAFSAVDKPN
ncbi:MAG TPA: type ISP restriction/modification enzyme [Rhizomicrobium sp.]|nr:type ISP restriction/modification enzyme [Rhizomicrobium sp.]